MIASGTVDMIAYAGDLNNLRVAHTTGDIGGNVFRVTVTVEGDNTLAFDLLRRLTLVDEVRDV